jgi:hypothetical protein
MAPLGLIVGAGTGIVIGLLFGNVAVGLAVGAGIGLILGLFFDRQKQKSNDV